MVRSSPIIVFPSLDTALEANLRARRKPARGVIADHRILQTGGM
jgi:hypothetical protein